MSLAGILSLSSLGLVAKVLADKGLLKELIGLRIFTAVIIAEVIALLVVGLTIGGESQSVSALAVLTLLGQIAGFTIVIWILSAKLLPRVMALLQRFLNVPELSYGLLIGGLFLVVRERRTSACTAHWERSCSALPCLVCLTGCARTSCQA